MKKIFLMIMVLVLSLVVISCELGGELGGNDPDPGNSSFTVTWNLNYSGAASPETETVAAGTLLTVPAEPSRAGFTFTGWYREALCDNI